MIWPFNRVKKELLSPDAIHLLSEVKNVLSGAPKDARSFSERIGPYAAKQPQVDPLCEASAYLQYVHINGAIEALRVALATPERVAQLAWLPDGTEYAESVLARLEKIAAVACRVSV